MRLATPEQVLEVMGIGNNTGSVLTAGAALDATSRIVENMLETNLEEATYTDFFDYEYHYARARFTPQTFMLSNRFLDSSVPVAVRESTSALQGVTEGDAVDSTRYIVDSLNGTLTNLQDFPLGFYTVSVTYTAGFPTTGTDKVLKDAPDWLVRAGIVAAQHFMSLTPAHVSSKKVTSATDIARSIREVLSVLINPYRRARMGMNFPGRTVRHD